MNAEDKGESGGKSDDDEVMIGSAQQKNSLFAQKDIESPATVFTYSSKSKFVNSDDKDPKLTKRPSMAFS